MLVDRGEILFMIVPIFFLDLLNDIIVLCDIIIVKSDLSFERNILNSFKIAISRAFIITLL